MGYVNLLLLLVLMAISTKGDNHPYRSDGLPLNSIL